MTFFAIVTFVKQGAGFLGLLGYIGPDVFLPVTSALAAVGGVLLMFWHKIAGFVVRLFGRSQPAPPASPSKPERD